MPVFIICMIMFILSTGKISVTFAGDFDQIIRSVNVQRPNTTTQVFSGKVYGSTIAATITDTDGNNTNFSGTDTITTTLTNRFGNSLSFTGTDSELETFVQNNSKAILEIIFPSGIASAVIGIDDSQAFGTLVFDQLVAPTLSPRDQAFSTGLVDQLAPLREAQSMIDVEDFEVDGVSGTSIKFVPGYTHGFGKFELGFTVPLKYSVLDDLVNTDSINAGLDIHGRYPIITREKWAVFVLGGTFFNVLTFTSDALPIGGFMRYGGFGGFSARARFGPIYTSGGVTYTASQFYIPEIETSTVIEDLVSSLNERPLDQQIIIGGTVSIPFFVRYFLNLGVQQVETVGPSAIRSGQQSYTRGKASLGIYLTESFALDIGYKRVFGLDGVESQSGLLLARFNFD